MTRKLIDFLEEAHAELARAGSDKSDSLQTPQAPLKSPSPLPFSEKDMIDYIRYAKREGKRTLDTFKDVLIVNHFDSDGLCSGSIVALALKSRQIPFKILTVKKMTDSVISQVSGDKSNYVIFVDIGTGFLDQINQICKSGKTILQIDHHLPEKIDGKSDGFSIINCHNFGIDGTFYLCSSSSAYFAFADNCPVEASKRIAQLGIIGAIGDIQDAKGMLGPNYRMLEEARKIKVVDVVKDLRLFGRVSRSLVSFLSFSSEPFLPTLTGNPKNCAHFLRKNGIPLFREEGGGRKWLRYYDLTLEERINLIGALLNFCFEKKVSEEAIKSMLGEVYLFPHENRQTELYDAYEFSSLLNACGREGRPEIGINLCMGEPDAYGAAHSLLMQHRIEISKGIQLARKKTEDMGAFYLLDARNEIPDSVIGTIAGSYFNSGTIERNKPIIALSIDETGQIKASSRAFGGLVENGLNLNEVMNLACKEAGGFGGGHSVAAGASFPNTDEALSKFLLAAKKAIRHQIVI
jgi:single-stranded-DNA-specific exonuclease